jgi:hypothetical protein
VAVSLIVGLVAANSGARSFGTIARAQGATRSITVKSRLIGWVARRDGYHLYREGATLRMVVVAWPDLSGERVRARLEWRRAHRRWRLLDVRSARLNRESEALFLVRGLPDGYSFRIRARVASTDEHRAGRSPWRYFRVI